MLPPLAVSLFGGVLAGRLSPLAGTLHVLAIFAAVYTAHVKDGYVDFHVRDEDDDHPLTERGCRLALAASTLLFFAAVVGLWTLASPAAALLTLPTWLIGYFHAPQLDVNPVGATTGYPLGIALALLGGFYAQAGTLEPIALAFAAVFLVLLSGVKVVDDAKDFEYDRSIDKRTVAVVLGRRRARETAYGLMVAAMVGVVGLAVASLFPPTAALAALAFAAVALFARRADPELATMLLIRGSYVFLAVLLVAVWFRPLAS
jgi:1,4-dihydroxy-2-naphthoate octaprenyltransferase